MAQVSINSKIVEFAIKNDGHLLLWQSANGSGYLLKAYSEAEIFRNERAILQCLRHPRILAWESETEFPHEGVIYPALEFRYNERPQTLYQWVESESKKVTNEPELKKLTHSLACKLLEITETLAYIHRNQIVHLGLNPHAVFVSQNQIYLMEFGRAARWNSVFSENMLRGNHPFIHPELAAAANRKTQLDTIQRLKADIDIYALGKTILALLGTIDTYLPDITVYDYAFSYLHLSACRMLQGFNADDDHAKVSLSQFKETWLNLKGNDFRPLAYKSMQTICYDLEKLLGKVYLHNEVPECAPVTFRGILVQEDAVIPLTERVHSLINHPIFSRLKAVQQLDLIDEIYPTCRHTRYEHSLGVFYQTIQMVNHLYNDEYNPLFRQLVNTTDIKKVLLYAILHDIAQYPFAHTIEECLPESYHENFTEVVLRNSSKDSYGRTIQEIIEDSKTGWGLDFEDFIAFVAKTGLFAARDIKSHLLKSIVDGPVDADKLDYLLRDSRACGLAYGECIDHQRLYRNLTVVMERKPTAPELKLAVYDKGATAADSLSFARYMLYRSVYWHHTSRAIRAMVNAVVQQIVRDEKHAKKQIFLRKLKKILGFEGIIQAVSTDAMLVFLQEQAAGPAVEIAEMLRTRNYYKLLYDFDVDRETSTHDVLLQKFRQVGGKYDFNMRLQQRILEVFMASVAHHGVNSTSLLSTEQTERTAELLRNKLAILTDAPPPSVGARHKLQVVPVPKSIRKNYRYHSDSYSRTTGVWDKIHHHLMDLAAVARVYCHPAIRENLLAALGPQGIREALVFVLE